MYIDIEMEQHADSRALSGCAALVGLQSDVTRDWAERLKALGSAVFGTAEAVP
jgi:hypothetical protein